MQMVALCEGPLDKGGGRLERLVARRLASRLGLARRLASRLGLARRMARLRLAPLLARLLRPPALQLTATDREGEAAGFRLGGFFFAKAMVKRRQTDEVGTV